MILLVLIFGTTGNQELQRAMERIDDAVKVDSNSQVWEKLILNATNFLPSIFEVQQKEKTGSDI